MKKILCVMLIMTIAISLFGCSSNNNVVPDVKPDAKPNTSDDKQNTPSDEPGITGYVMKKENSRILVISQESKNFSATGGVKEFYNAIWFSKVSDNIKVGDKVKVWFDLVLESYPGQSEAENIEVVPGQKPEGADITESEALSRALGSKEVDADIIVVVKTIGYDKKTDIWSIVMKDVSGEKIYTIQIEDK